MAALQGRPFFIFFVDYRMDITGKSSAMDLVLCQRFYLPCVDDLKEENG